MKQYRKTQTIEVVEYQKETDSFLVQYTGDTSDRWHIDKNVFKGKYEEVKAIDYTVLTKDERDRLRDILSDLLSSMAKCVFASHLNPDEMSKQFIQHQREAGELHKSFTDKATFLLLKTKEYEELEKKDV